MIIKTVIFDLDNTIYPEADYFKEIFSAFCLKNNLNVSTFDFLQEDFDYYRFNKKDIFKFALEEVGLYSQNFHDQLFDYFISIECTLKPYQGIDEWFKYCRESNIKIGVLTNGHVKAQTNKWKCLNLNKAQVEFQPARIYSLEKPSEIPFNGIIKHLGAEFKSTVFIGDRFENDLSYGHKNGSICLLIHPTNKIEESDCFINVQSAFKHFRSLPS
jgi:putative hydrolase of the HAD superfamily